MVILYSVYGILSTIELIHFKLHCTNTSVQEIGQLSPLWLTFVIASGRNSFSSIIFYRLLYWFPLNNPTSTTKKCFTMLLWWFFIAWWINVREYKRCNQKWTIQRNWYTRRRQTKQLEAPRNLYSSPGYDNNIGQ